MKPAPAAIRISSIGIVNPVGRPFNFGSCDSDRGVFAMQIGRPS